MKLEEWEKPIVERFERLKEKYQTTNTSYSFYKAGWLAAKKVEHNHFTRDIKPYGECPACDEYHKSQLVLDYKGEIDKLKLVNEALGRKAKESMDDREYFKVELTKALYLLRVVINNINDEDDELTKLITKLIKDNSHTAAYFNSLAEAKNKEWPLIDEALI